jgi:hypothetical protein
MDNDVDDDDSNNIKIICKRKEIYFTQKNYGAYLNRADPFG